MQISMSFAAFLAAILFISAPLAQAQTAEDQAALAAAQAAGGFPGAGSELLLPVVFRLSD